MVPTGGDAGRRAVTASRGSYNSTGQSERTGPTSPIVKRRLFNRRAFVATSVAGGLGALTIGPWTFNFLMDRVEEIGREIPAAPHKPSPASWSDNAVTLAWLGHATVLINFFGVRILTDPTLYPRIGVDLLLGSLGPLRLVQCALTPAEVPDIDLVLVSHAHFDHLDTPSLGSVRGGPAAVMAVDATLAKHADHWLVRETIGLWRRTLSRLDVSARSVFALIDRGSCFAGTLLELALAADRSYMLALPDERDAEPAIALSAQNFGAYPMCNGRTRLANRFAVDTLAPDRVGGMLTSDAAREAGLVTFTPDDIDWDDEIRLALEERASLSPDALSGMEASLRFSGPETMHARIFGRLAAWQNWVFQRPNAAGKDGALKLFGSGTRAKFDWERV